MQISNNFLKEENFVLRKKTKTQSITSQNFNSNLNLYFESRNEKKTCLLKVKKTEKLYSHSIGWLLLLLLLLSLLLSKLSSAEWRCCCLPLKCSERITLWKLIPGMNIIYINLIDNKNYKLSMCYYKTNYLL